MKGHFPKNINQYWYVVVDDEGELSKGSHANTSPKLYKYEKVAKNNFYVRMWPERFKVVEVKLVPNESIDS